MPKKLKYDDRIKIKIKVRNLSGQWRWQHFCYAPRDLVLEHEAASGRRMYDSVKKWAKEQIGVNLTTVPAMNSLRERIVSMYRDDPAYADMFSISSFSSQGWPRLWVVQNIKEELREFALFEN